MQADNFDGTYLSSTYLLEAGVLSIVIGRLSRFTPFPYLTDDRDSPRMLLPEASDDVVHDDCYKVIKP